MRSPSRAGNWVTRLVADCDAIAAVPGAGMVRTARVSDGSFLIRARGLTHHYDVGGRAIIADLSLDIAPGEIVAVVGRSGSGKTTLLHLIGAMARPGAGTICVDGEDMATWNDRERTAFRRRRLGFVFQAYNLLPTLTVRENVALPLELNDLPVTADIARLLASLGLEGLADRYPDELSGGEQQRTAIARAVVHGPALIIADEPTGNLDSDSGQDVIRLFEHRARAAGAAVLMATHSLDMVGRADRVLELKDGVLADLRS